MHPWLKMSTLAVLPLAGTLCFTPLASADRDDGARGRYEDQMSDRDFRSFQQYLESHRETAQQLAQNPILLRDRRFVRDHDALNDWLESHPDAAEALRANPQRYLSQRDSQSEERRYGSTNNRSDGRTAMNERDLRSFESYLDSHDETAQTLYQNPNLINDRRFVRNHDSLNDWMQNHPEAAQVLQADPDRYLWRERNTSAADFLGQLLGTRR